MLSQFPKRINRLQLCDPVHSHFSDIQIPMSTWLLTGDDFSVLLNLLGEGDVFLLWLVHNSIKRHSSLVQSVQTRESCGISQCPTSFEAFVNSKSKTDNLQRILMSLWPLLKKTQTAFSAENKSAIILMIAWVSFKKSKFDSFTFEVKVCCFSSF